MATSFRDGLGNDVEVGAETLVRVCAALGAEIERSRDADAALRTHTATRRVAPAVRVAWDGRIDLRSGRDSLTPAAVLRVEGTAGMDERPLRTYDDGSGVAVVPFGVHELEVEMGGDVVRSTVIAAPTLAWRSPAADSARWGVAVHLGALRSGRSRSVGDLSDLRSLAGSVAAAGGSVVTVLPILPTFNDPPIEPSPYSPVSRLFWSELVLDVGPGSGAPVDRIDVATAAAEVDRALADVLLDADVVDAASIDAELARYARFRGAQHRLGRDWRTWPATARNGRLGDALVDPAVERFHLAAQLAVRDQLDRLRRDLDATGVRLGLDLAVGVHPEGYDVWSRPHLFADTMAVGATPDAGFPSGQNWGFHPMLPEASAAEGHRYFRAAIAHQASLAGLLRIDHIMALRRLYWIPEGMALDQGTYVSYPMEELFAVLCLESHLRACEVIGENLGTVPPELDAALGRHGINGMRLTQFSVGGGRAVGDVAADEVAFIGTHDTPSFAGWLAGDDIDLRVDLGLLAAADAPAARAHRAGVTAELVAELGGSVDEPADLLERVIVALGSSPSPLVLLWLEDLWLEPRPVNVPGTSSTAHPNWQRPMRRRYDDALADPDVARLLAAIDAARRSRGDSA
ncbi:MAG: 4-alpha-glucanotransferase [Acidimicrobiales bacterium]